MGPEQSMQTPSQKKKNQNTGRSLQVGLSKQLTG